MAGPAAGRRGEAAVGDSGEASAVEAPRELAAVLAAAGPALPPLMARAEARLEEVARSHGDGLGRHASETLTAGGKRLRPLLVFLCAGAPAGEEGLVRAAVAVELVHMATLVHDDVLDRASLRRGRPTVFAAAGRSGATATGDLLFSRAFAELAAAGSRSAVETLSSASSSLARGELMQRADAWSADVTPERYLERCVLKTARLFEAACRLGAIFGPPGEHAAEPLGAFGRHIGLAFQILDDVLDVSGPSERTGKRRGTDLLDGTVTLPLILARRRDPGLRRTDLRRAAADRGMAEELCDRIAATGALDEARAQATSHTGEAKDVIRRLDLPASQVVALERVADGVVERYA